MNKTKCNSAPSAFSLTFITYIPVVPTISLDTRPRAFRHSQFQTSRALELYNQIDPIPELADARVHARLVGLRAPYPPGYDAREQEPPVRPLDDHGPAWVALAGVEAAPAPARADEDVRDVFDVARGPVHRLAHGVVDDGHGDLLEDAGQGTVWNVVELACDFRWEILKLRSTYLNY